MHSGAASASQFRSGLEASAILEGGAIHGAFTSGLHFGEFEGAVAAGNEGGALVGEQGTRRARILGDPRPKNAERLAVREVRACSGPGRDGPNAPRKVLGGLGPVEQAVVLGQLASEGRYETGKEEGPWRMFHPGGRLKALFEYSAGILEGAAEMHHASGELQWRGVYRAGLRQGEWLFGREDGSPSSAGAFEAGKREGGWTFWSKDGSIDKQRSGEYKGGELVTSLVEDD